MEQTCARLAPAPPSLACCGFRPSSSLPSHSSSSSSSRLAFFSAAVAAERRGRGFWRPVGGRQPDPPPLAQQSPWRRSAWRIGLSDRPRAPSPCLASASASLVLRHSRCLRAGSAADSRRGATHWRLVIARALGARASARLGDMAAAGELRLGVQLASAPGAPREIRTLSSTDWHRQEARWTQASHA